ncbi:MAG: outer membrane protein OmpU [Psychromonas sp.]|jgi:outer membrane protein OmpU|uniref:porin n=1 Tax=Psychromonas sp. TaxID=1884585 RepID=UPI0039E42B26
MTFNKYLMAITASTILSAPLSAATIYKNDTQDFNIGGRVEVRGNLTDSDYSDKSRVRLNVNGKNELNEDLTVFGRYEFEITEDEDEDNGTATLKTRHLYVGGETQFGTLIYGHQNNAVTYLTDFTDLAETFSGYINDKTATSADRSKNTLRYIYATDKLTFQASGTQNANNNADGFGLMAAYKLTSELELAAGITSSDQEYGNTTDATDTDTSNSYMLGARYTKDSIYLGANVMQGNISAAGISDSDFVAADAFAAYNFGADNSNTVNVSYSYYSADDIEALDTNFVGFEYARYIGNFAVYSSYKVALNNDNSSSSNDRENELQLGARYGF